MLKTDDDSAEANSPIFPLNYDYESFRESSLRLQ